MRQGLLSLGLLSLGLLSLGLLSLGLLSLGLLSLCSRHEPNERKAGGLVKAGNDVGRLDRST